MAAIAVIGYGLSRHVPISWQSAPSGWQSDPIVRSNRDTVPFVTLHDGIHITVTIGGYPTDMLLDTGASIVQISESLAEALIARHQAYPVAPGQVTIANGETITQQKILVSRLTIGRHSLTNVTLSVSPTGSNLLSLPVLKSIGKFTIDSARGQLTFG
jgi:predicted aspartyl protease